MPRALILANGHPPGADFLKRAIARSSLFVCADGGANIALLHGVTPQRLTWQYYRRRCFSEGISKAVVARRVGQESALEAEKAYVRHVLPRAVRRDLRSLRTWPRAAMVLLGVMFTAAGYGRGAIARPSG